MQRVPICVKVSDRASWSELIQHTVTCLDFCMDERWVALDNRARDDNNDGGGNDGHLLILASADQSRANSNRVPRNVYARHRRSHEGHRYPQENVKRMMRRDEGRFEPLLAVLISQRTYESV